MSQIEIKSLVIENFMLIRHAVLYFDNRGLVLIQGENSDGPASQSNGSGKSSIPDALFWCLYGTTARGIEGDKVVRRGHKDCRVTAIINDGEFDYYARRHRKHHTGKNALELWRGDPANGGVPLSKGTDKETQKLIERLLGSSEEVFTKAVYAGQERMPDLPMMTDSQLKEVVEEAAGLNEIKAGYEILKTRLTTAEKAAIAARAEHTRIESLLAEINTSITNTQQARLNWGHEHDTRLALLESTIKAKRELIVELQSDINNSGEQEIKDDLLQITTALQAHSAKLAEREQLSQQANDARVAEQEKRTALNIAQRECTNAASHVTTLESKIGTQCGECGKPYAAADLAVAREASERRVQLLQTQADSARAAYEAMAAESFMSDAVLRAFKVDSVDELVARQTQLQQERDAINALKEQLAEARTALSLHETQFEQERTTPNPYDSQLVNDESRLTELGQQLAHARATREQSEIAETRLRDACEVFGPKGVRALILDTKTPFLNQRTGYYLTVLTEGEQTAEWTTLVRLKGGEVREKFSIIVSSRHGADSFKGLSGGEKRKVRIACTLALQDLVSMRALKPLRLWLGDEIDDALDVAGLERLMGLLEEKATERGTVVIISHNSLRDWIREITLVTRQNNESTIAGALAQEIMQETPAQVGRRALSLMGDV